MASGIYIIQSISFPERQYVGSCIDFNLRWMVHRSNLHYQKHHNAKLQNHVNKYGILDLLFLIVEHCPREKLIYSEQFYINALKPYFNINQIAGSRLNSHHSPGTRLKMRQSAKSCFLRKKRDIMRSRFVKLGL